MARSRGRDQDRVGLATARDRDRDRDRGRRGEVTTRGLNLGRGLGVEDGTVIEMTICPMVMLAVARSEAEQV